MEREVGEVFDFKGIKLQVKDTGCKASCDGCYFDEFWHLCVRNVCGIYAGYCYGPFRSDGKNAIFVEVEYNQIRKISNE